MKEVRYWLFANPVTGKSWWAVLLIGILYLIAGIVVLARPVESLIIIMYVIGVFMVIGGLWRLLIPLMRKSRYTGWLVLSGLLMLLIGILILTHTLIAAWALTVFAGIWMLFSGFDLLVTGIGAPSGTPGRGLVIFDGVVSILLGLLVAFTFYGAVTLALLVGIYLIVFGAFAISGAMVLHHVCKNGKCPSEVVVEEK